MRLSANLDLHVAEANPLADANLAGLAQFDFAVDGDRTAGNQDLARATAIAKTGQLEQLVELDVVAAWFKIEDDSGHGRYDADIAVRKETMSDNEANEAIDRAFAAVPERNTGDALLRTMQQHHVQLSVMADTKANILITVSSIILTLVLGKMNDPDLRDAMMTLGGFIFLALLLAVIAVLPKYRPLRVGAGPLPETFNMLFFGHFAELPKTRFLLEIAETLKADGSVYQAMARDVYSIGYYLAHYKYRYLRLSYLFFLGGFVFAALVAGVHVLRT